MERNFRTVMKTSLIIAIVSSLPLLAQEPAPAPQPEAPTPAPQGEQAQPQGQGMHRGHGRPHRVMMNPEQRKQMLEKFDTDKDGKLSDEERKAAREEFMKNHPQMPGRRGPRGGHGGWHHGPQGGPQQAPAPQQGEQPAPAPAPEQPAPAPQA